VALDNDSDIVQVSELQIGCSDTQKQLVDSALQPLKEQENFSHSAMVALYVIAKTFVGNLIEQ
jgi:hypothetical protein